MNRSELKSIYLQYQEEQLSKEDYLTKKKILIERLEAHLKAKEQKVKEISPYAEEVAYEAPDGQEQNILFINKWMREKELSGRMCDCFLDKVKVQNGKQVEVVFKFAEK